MRISVAMCTCNGAAYVRQQLQSIAAQELKVDQVVICDDASDDDTARIVSDFAASSPIPIHLARNPQRLGTTRNFQQAVSLCHGDFIFLSDQDDVWLSHKTRCMVEVFTADPQAGVVFSNAQVVNDQLEPLGYQVWESLWFTPREQTLVKSGQAARVFLKHVVAAGGTLAFRASLRDLILPFPELEVAHDAWIALLAAAVGRVAIVDESLIQYRLHDANQVGLRRLGLREQFQQARKQIQRQAFRYAVDLHATALTRLTSGLPASYHPRTDVLKQLEEKLLHSRRRDAMNGSLATKAKTVLCELISLRYFQYSYGWKSVAQDVFLR